MTLPDDRDTADQLHTTLTAAGAHGSLRVLDSGQWVVRLLRGGSRQGFTYPSADHGTDEWLASMADRLEAAAGVRPEVETEG